MKIASVSSRSCSAKSLTRELDNTDEEPNDDSEWKN